MPTEIEFSVMIPSEATIRPVIRKFEEETGIKVRLRLLDWDTAWNVLVRAALYSDGPDICEIGTTWTGDMIGMNALRPFEAYEIVLMGRSGAYLPAAWKSTGPFGDRSWAMPWMTGSRVMYYRPRLFEKAGVDPQQAFTSPAAFEAALSKLQSAGVKSPWVPPLGNVRDVLHTVSTWLWAAGGDYVRPDGRSTSFLDTESLEGICSYFNLARYVSQEYVQSKLECEPYFFNNPDAAVLLSGTWSSDYIAQHTGGADPVALAVTPGPSFVGGSNLVIWKYSRHTEAAVKLVRFLCQTDTQAAYSQAVGLLPARADALDLPPFSTDPYWQIASQTLRSGRSFPAIRLWGLIEERMTTSLVMVWNDVLANPAADTLEIVRRHLQPLSHRLDLLLSER
jgi:multiple sugar transport system substrate-binding protein